MQPLSSLYDQRLGYLQAACGAMKGNATNRWFWIQLPEPGEYVLECKMIRIMGSSQNREESGGVSRWFNTADMVVGVEATLELSR